MLAEFVKEIRALAVKAEGLKIVPHPHDERKFFTVFGDVVEEKESPAPPRRCEAETVEDFASAFNILADGEAPNEIWIERSRAFAWLDGERRGRLELPLPESAELATLRKLGGGPLTHPRLVELLRHDLHRAVHDGVLLALKSVDFAAGVKGSSSRTHAGGGFGKTVEEEVRSKQGELPETIVASVPVWKVGDAAWRQDVELILSADGVNQQFTLRPAPNAIDLAVEQARLKLKAKLLEFLPEASVFLGASADALPPTRES